MPLPLFDAAYAAAFLLRHDDAAADFATITTLP